MVENHFENIDKVIGDFFLNSYNSIDIAFAWLTKNGLIRILCQKFQLDEVKIRIILSDDILNIKFTNLRRTLEESGIEMYISKITKLNSIMHNKFCIIDNQIIEKGSFNWTKSATNNHENIVVIKNNSEFVLNM